jgi:signal transduction histidine kinase/CheY-like chemotaxis protein
MRGYVARLLGTTYEVEATGDAESALDLALARPPDLILSDVTLPGMDGFGLLHALRTDPATAEVPVILLSARAGEEAKVAGLRAGADDYLVKPFSARELLARVEAHLTLAQLRNETRAKLDLERGRLHELFAQTPAAICLLEGPEHVFRLANPLYLELIGPRDVLGRPIREALPELHGQDVLDLLDRVYRTGEPFVGMGVLVRVDRDKDGEPEDLYFNFVYAPFRSGVENATTGIFVHAYEVTDQVLARRQAERLANQLEQALGVATDAVRAREEFLSIAAHELRNPVAAIRSAAQLLLRFASRDRLDPERAERFARTIETSSGKLTRLIEDLLDASRLSTGQLRLRRELVALGPLIAQIGADIQQRAPKHQLRLEVPAESVEIFADVDRLEQVLINLLENAAKYSPDGGAIVLTVESDHAGVTTRVRDRGIGLPVGAAEAIFQPFGRAANAVAHDMPGTGLGLYISRQIATAHGGYLRAESGGEGLGTTVTLWLPYDAGGATSTDLKHVDG